MKVLSEVVREKSFALWAKALKEPGRSSGEHAPVIHLTFRLEGSFDIRKHYTTGEESEAQIAVLGWAEPAGDDGAYTVQFSELGRPPACDGKTALTIEPKDRLGLTKQILGLFTYQVVGRCLETTVSVQAFQPKEIIMPFARIDLAQGKTPEYRATVGDIVYEGIVGVLKAPDGDRFMVIGEHKPENFVFDPNFLDIKRSPDLIYIQVTSTVGNTKEQKLAFFRQVADELNRRLSVRREDVFISLVFVDREDWSFGNGEPW